MNVKCICGHSIKEHDSNGCKHEDADWVFCKCNLTPIEIRKIYLMLYDSIFVGKLKLRIKELVKALEDK